MSSTTGTPVAPALALDAEPAPLREAGSMRDSPERRRTGEATPARLARIMRAYLERSGSSSDAD